MNNYVQGKVVDNETRFTKAPVGELEFSTMVASPIHLTTFNAGDIVPIYYSEVLPHDTFDIDLDAVVRQTTSLVPVMGAFNLDVYAFFVPNRIINKGWVNVMGENTSSSWIAPQVELAPLVVNLEGTTQIPVGSVADYYGFPTQKGIPNTLLAQCNDMKFKGYLSIYNHYFRDENYTPPIPFSTLNVYNGFLEPVGSYISLFPGSMGMISGESDGSYENGGSFIKEVYGEGVNLTDGMGRLSQALTSWSALDKPLKANKYHDMFTSVLPAPQKGREVNLTLGGLAPVVGSSNMHSVSTPLKFTSGSNITGAVNLVLNGDGSGLGNLSLVSGTVSGTPSTITLTNAVADLRSLSTISVNDFREAIALQQVFEILARGGSRYLMEFVSSFFGIEADNPYPDIPQYLGHFRRELDLYQTAQTSADTDNSPLASLGAFGYTNLSSSLIHKTFLEHGYIHIFAVVRHKNVYSTYFARDNFRKSMLDYYSYPLANLGEMPVYTREINPFLTDTDNVFGYQEAWYDYRYEPNRVSGEMRNAGADNPQLSVWNLADDFDESLSVCTDDFIKSNSEEVLNRSVAVSSSTAPQFKGQFMFRIKKERAMPTYSVPGLDII